MNKLFITIAFYSKPGKSCLLERTAQHEILQHFPQNGTVSSSSHVKFWTKPLNIDEAVGNEFLSTARKNGHLKEHLLQ